MSKDPHSPSADQSAEKTALLTLLERRRQFLLATATGLTEDQARSAPTTSTLSIGGLIKHCRFVEAEWIDFARRGPAAFDHGDWDTDGDGEAETGAGVGDLDWAQLWDAQNALTADETLADVIAALLDQGTKTAAVVADLDLDSAHPLPEAPWFEAGAVWSGRDTVMHVIAELAHHSGHADIIRETIDGAKTMG